MIIITIIIKIIILIMIIIPLVFYSVLSSWEFAHSRIATCRFPQVKSLLYIFHVSLDRHKSLYLRKFLENMWNISLLLTSFPYPINTRRRFNVYKTSIQCRQRRIEVLQTLKQRRVSTGYTRRLRNFKFYNFILT